MNQNDAHVSNTIDPQEDKLTEYCVYEHPLLPMRIVKQGFCWPALIVGPAYLIYRKLWVPLVVWFVFLGLVRYFSVIHYSNYLNSGNDADTVELIYIGGFFLGLLILGSETNSLWKNNLMNRGYVKTNSLFARSVDGVLAIVEREKIAKQNSTIQTGGAQVNDQNIQQSSAIKNIILGWSPSGFSMAVLLVASIIIIVVISSVPSEDSRRAGQERLNEQTNVDSVDNVVKRTLASRKAALPNSVITPGAINASITQENIQQALCSKEYIKANRTPAKKQLILAYGITDTPPNKYEEDHLIPISIGGEPNDSRNIWPLPLWDFVNDKPPFWGADKKDELELALYKKVCVQEITLKEAQYAISTNWEEAWNKYYSAPLRGFPVKGSH